jgi:hypothetical protein
MTFAKWTFRIAGIYGILALAPHYFLEEAIGLRTPPPLTHPEYFYGFVGVALAWQFVFLLVSGDPARFRPLMLPAIFEKLAFGVPSFILIAKGWTPPVVSVPAAIDLLLASLFLASFLKTRPPAP